MRSLMRVSTVMWPPQSFYPRRNRARGHAAQGHTPDTTRPRTHLDVRGPQIRPVDAVCCLSTHNVNTGIRLGIPGPDPAASRRFGWERAPLAASAGTEVGRSQHRIRYNTQRSLRAKLGWTLLAVMGGRGGRFAGPCRAGNTMNWQRRWRGNGVMPSRAARRRRCAGTGRCSWSRLQPPLLATLQRSRCLPPHLPRDPYRSPSPTI
jgi:hypothetical protein